MRVLDWVTDGLGRYVIAARVAGAAGPFVTLTWPGYTGVLQAHGAGPLLRRAQPGADAPPRSATSISTGPSTAARVWRMPHLTPAHLLREVFETATSFEDAKRMLAERPISSPAIYSLAGIKPGETAVIERTETEARVHEGANAAANHWQTPGWSGSCARQRQRRAGAADAQRHRRRSTRPFRG